MSTKHKFGLIGYPLSHTFSPTYFAKKFEDLSMDNYEYAAYELADVSELADLLTKGLRGINVTIPYKEQVQPFLDGIDEEAQKIGAVNTIKITNGNIVGYNTDVYGFKMSLLAMLNGKKIRKALVLGSGGAAKAVKYALEDLGILYSTVSRKKIYLNYSDLSKEIIEDHQLIVNTTPLGMSPNVNNCPDLPYHHLNEQHFLYDLVYNPEKTLFLKKGSANGASIKNGYDMLVLQAEKSWEIWNQ